MYAWLSEPGRWCKWNTKNLYWFGLRMPYVQCEIGSLYCLVPKGACSRSVQAGCERGLSPKSRLCVMGRALLATLCENSLGVWCCFAVVVCCVDGRVLVVSPGSSFIVSRGTQGFTCMIGDLLCWVVMPQSWPYRSLPIPSLRHGWHHGCSCEGLPSPVEVVGVGSVILQPVL